MARSGDALRREGGPGWLLVHVVDSGDVPGIIAYADGEPVGWCAIEPRERYAVLERSRTLKRIDGQPVWSVTCFFVAKAFRGKGLIKALLNATVEYAKERGARLVEGYPVEPFVVKQSPASGFLGTTSTFKKAGFEQAAHPTEKQAVMRRGVG